MNVQAIAWDFDGVIVTDSEFLKEEAWPCVLAEYPGAYETHFPNAQKMFGFGKKGDRRDILRHIFAQMHFPDGEIAGLVKSGSERFNDHVQSGIQRLGLAHGCVDVLEYASRKYVQYINTGTATDAAKESIKNLGIGRYFKDVLGGPASKLENLEEISRREKITPAQLLLIGDSDGDVRAAEQHGCEFIGVANRWNGWGQAGKLFRLVNGLPDLLRHL